MKFFAFSTVCSRDVYANIIFDGVSELQQHSCFDIVLGKFIKDWIHPNIVWQTTGTPIDHHPPPLRRHLTWERFGSSSLFGWSKIEHS